MISLLQTLLDMFLVIFLKIICEYDVLFLLILTLVVNLNAISVQGPQSFSLLLLNALSA